MCKLCEWLSDFFNGTPIEPPIPEPDPEPEPDPIEKGKYALLVGINRYLQPGSDLQGCVNDVMNLRTILIIMFGFDPNNIIVLTDSEATRYNTLKNLEWLVNHENSELVYQNSSHGSYVVDLNGDEIDGYDEILIPYDHNWNNPLTDDILGDLFDLVPASSFLTFICDSCHSGTVSRSFNENANYPRFLNPKIIKDVNKPIKKIGTRVIGNNHILYSGCRDNQYSADAYLDGRWQGAFTESFTNYISPDKTLGEIHPYVLDRLVQKGFAQVPQLSGLAFEIDDRYIFGGN